MDQLDSLTDAQRDKLMDLDLTTRPGMNFGFIGQIALWLIAIYVMSALFNYVESWIVTPLLLNVLPIVSAVTSVKRLTACPCATLDSHPFGDVLSRITNDVDMVSQKPVTGYLTSSLLCGDHHWYLGYDDLYQHYHDRHRPGHHSAQRPSYQSNC